MEVYRGGAAHGKRQHDENRSLERDAEKARFVKGCAKSLSSIADLNITVIFPLQLCSSHGSEIPVAAVASRSFYVFFLQQ